MNRLKRWISLYPTEPDVRRTSRRNGWLTLTTLPLLQLIFGIDWFLESPGWLRFLTILHIPAITTCVAIAAIRWGGYTETSAQ